MAIYGEREVNTQNPSLGYVTGRKFLAINTIFRRIVAIRWMQLFQQLFTISPFFRACHIDIRATL